MLDNKTPVVIALGYFDSVHLGHKKVIEQAKKEADLHGAKTVVFTFKGNLRAIISNENEKQVYTLTERETFLYELGVDEIYFAPVNFTFLSMAKLAFLNLLNRKYNIIGYVCGEDYRFGKFGLGDVEYLKKYATGKGQTVTALSMETIFGKRISTTEIKKMLSLGNVSSANLFLGRAYSISGTVFQDRKVGRKLGFPTINIKLDSDKHRLKDGVYSGHVFIDGERYGAVINYGARPTFSLKEKLVETHIIDFDGELYGKRVTVFFDNYLRDIMKFDDEGRLKEQLKKDVLSVKGREND